MKVHVIITGKKNGNLKEKKINKKIKMNSLKIKILLSQKQIVKSKTKAKSKYNVNIIWDQNNYFHTCRHVYICSMSNTSMEKRREGDWGGGAKVFCEGYRLTAMTQASWFG